MASNIAFNPTEQPRELCRLVEFSSLIEKTPPMFADIFFPMHVDTVINVFIHMIEQMV